MTKKLFYLLSSSFFAIVMAVAQEKPFAFIPINLANSYDTSGTTEKLPTLQFFSVEDSINTGICVLICPGGGYTHLAYDKEGVQVALRLNKVGIQAFVLDYRYNDRHSERKYHYPAPFDDVSSAMRLIRQNAAYWNINPSKIGVMGFSAGGHLAATLSNHHDLGDSLSDNTLLRISSRPDFSVLIYPVITFTKEDYVHKGSRYNLLGEKHYNDTLWMNKLSQELQVHAGTPPTFLLHADDDKGVKPENSVLYYMALKTYKIPASIHVLPSGGHGFGLAPNHPSISNWSDLLVKWLMRFAD